MNGNLRATKALFLVVVLLITASLSAQQMPQQTFKTTIYFDYTYDLTNTGFITGVPSRQDLNNKFHVRRAYFTYENKINDNLRFRFRYDADNLKAVDAAGKKDDKLRPFIKHLYLEWSNLLLPNSKWNIGMTETLTWSRLEEKKWGYRSIAKTLLDGFKDVTGKEIDASSADLGVSLQGAVSKELRYAFMVNNGSGYSKPEGDKFKKLSGWVQLVPVAGLSLVGYMDYEKQDKDNKAITYKADAYFEMIKGLTVGAVWFVYDNDKNYYLRPTGKVEFNRSGYTVFANYRAVPDKLSLFARLDGYEPDTDIKDDEITLVIAGLDWTPSHAAFKLQPNIWYYSYNDSRKKADVVFALTFFMEF